MSTNNVVAFGNVPLAHEAEEPPTPVLKGREEVFCTPPVATRGMHGLGKPHFRENPSTRAMKAQEEDLYATIGVPRNAPQLQIEAHFQLGMRTLQGQLEASPNGDQNQTRQTLARLASLKRAYARLSKPQSRLAYDRFQHCDMNQISHQLFLGSAAAPKYPKTLLQQGVLHIVSLTSGGEETAAALMGQLQIGVRDRESLFVTTQFEASDDPEDSR